MTTDEPDPVTTDFPQVERRGRGPGLYNDDRHPRQRKSDHGWRYWAPWFYKHIMPAIAIIIAAVAVGFSADASSTAEDNATDAKNAAAEAKRASAGNQRALVAIQEGRRAAISESCTQDEQIADVVRKALLGFGVGRPGNPAPPEVADAFKPLGGLKPLTREEQKKRCDARIARGGP